MVKKQYYIPGKEYEWTKETWEAVNKADSKNAWDEGPLLGTAALVPLGRARYKEIGSTECMRDTLDICWEWSHWSRLDEYWHFTINEEGIEIPECLIPFYGEKESKEILSAVDLEVGKEYIMCLGANDERNIIYWGKNSEVIFITELLYHTYGHIFIKDIFHFRNIPEKTREEKLSEKYNVSLDTIKQMVEDGLIQEEED
jgi:hypothetical protein